MTRFLLSASLLALSVPAAAQVADDDEIIVTGIAVQRTADEIVGNVTAIDRAELVTDLQSTLGDTLDREPGVSTTFFGAGASRPVLRGLGSERVLVLTNGIGVIDASAASPDHQVTADGIDAERVEIVRGPAALAYGGQAIGGVVNVIDGLIAESAPEDAIEGSAFAAYNTVNDGLEGAVRAQGALGPLVLTGSVSARDFDLYDIPGATESDVLLELEGEEAEDAGELENSFVETTTLAGGASYLFDGGFLGVSVRNQQAEYGLPGGHAHEDGEGEEGEGEGGEAEDEEEEENPFIDLEQTRIDARGQISPGLGLAQKVIASVVYADYDHTEFEAPGEAGTIYETEGWEGRLEATHSFGLLEGSIGVQAIDKEFGAFGEEAFISPTDTQSLALFAFERLAQYERFSFDGGVRFESVDYDNILFGEADFDLISASVGAHVHEDEAWFAGVELSYTERAPNESELFALGPHLATRQFEVGDRTLAEERGLNLEGTVRVQQGPFRAGVNVFATQFDNFIALLPGAIDGETEEDGLPVFAYIQDNADFFGGEIYGEAQLESVRVKLSADYVEGELERDAGDVDVPLLPPLTFNAEADAAFGPVLVGAALTWADDQDDPGPGRLRTDGYTRVDFSAALNLSDLGIDYGRGEGMQIFAQLRNAFDEDIRYASSTLKDEVPAPGRNVRIGLKADF